MPMEEYADFRTRRQHTVWHSLNRLLVALIAFTVITLIACAFVPELKNAREQDDRVDQLHDSIDKERDLLAQHTRQVELLKNDPTYIETIARDRLDPTLPKAGPYQARWRLQLNVESEELEAIRHT